MVHVVTHMSLKFHKIISHLLTMVMYTLYKPQVLHHLLTMAPQVLLTTL